VQSIIRLIRAIFKYYRAGIPGLENVPKINVYNTVKLYILDYKECIMFKIFYIERRHALDEVHMQQR
jgi:hypothetical protein